jgi:hypothetical protein
MMPDYVVTVAFWTGWFVMMAGAIGIATALLLWAARSLFHHMRELRAGCDIHEALTDWKRRNPDKFRRRYGSDSEQ